MLIARRRRSAGHPDRYLGFLRRLYFAVRCRLGRLLGDQEAVESWLPARVRMTEAAATTRREGRGRFGPPSHLSPSRPTWERQGTRHPGAPKRTPETEDARRDGRGFTRAGSAR